MEKYEIFNAEKYESDQKNRKAFVAELRIMLLHLAKAYGEMDKNYEISGIKNEKVKALADKFFDQNGELKVDEDLPDKVKELFDQPVTDSPHIVGGLLSDSVGGMLGALERLMQGYADGTGQKLSDVYTEIPWPRFGRPEYVESEDTEEIEKVKIPETDEEIYERVTKFLSEEEREALKRVFAKE